MKGSLLLKIILESLPVFEAFTVQIYLLRVVEGPELGEEFLVSFLSRTPRGSTAWRRRLYINGLVTGYRPRGIIKTPA